MLVIQNLYIYPIKSLGGIEVDKAMLTDRGFQFDRRYMLVDDAGRFISQREQAKMALLHTKIEQEKLIVFDREHPSDLLELDLNGSGGDTIKCQMFNDESEGVLVNETANAWFTARLGMNARLVFMPDDVKRKVDVHYALHEDVTGYTDGFPLLIIGQESLYDLNGRLEQPLPMNRFRPNIVCAGGVPFEEDTLKEFEISDVRFFAVKPCARCVVTTINQQTAQKGKEPLLTLSRYRLRNNKIYFGQNVLFNKQGIINVGDEIKIIQRQPNLF